MPGARQCGAREIRWRLDGRDRARRAALGDRGAIAPCPRDGRRAVMLRPIVKHGETILHTPASPVTAFDASLHTLIDDMIQTMYAAPGVGLAAPQVGVPLQVCVIDLSVGKRGGEVITLVNPEFVEQEGMQLEEEGCLSVPGFQATVARAQ